MFLTFKFIFFVLIRFNKFSVVSNATKLPLSIILASLASLFFSGRALAMDNQMYEHMNGKNMIQLSSKRIFYRGVFIFIGALIGGLISKTNFFIRLEIFENLIIKLHFVFLFSSISRIAVWIKFLRIQIGRAHV